MTRLLCALIVLTLVCGAVAGAQSAKKEPVPKVASADVKEIQPDMVVAARKAGRRVLPVDVRPAAQYKASHAADAINVPMARLLPRMKDLELPKKTEIVTMARPVALAEQAAKQLATAGYYVIGYCDLAKWENAGLPMENSRSAKKK